MIALNQQTAINRILRSTSILDHHRAPSHLGIGSSISTSALPGIHPLVARASTKNQRLLPRTNQMYEGGFGATDASHKWTRSDCSSRASAGRSDARREKQREQKSQFRQSAIAKLSVVAACKIKSRDREGFWRGDFKAKKTRSPSPRRSRVE